MTAFNVCQTGSLSGLQSTTFYAPVAGNYFLDAKIFGPNISAGSSANSQVVATVTQNGSTIYTSPSGGEGFRINVVCAVGDAIAVALTSSAAVDLPYNTIQAVLAFSNGDNGRASWSGD